MIAVLIRNLSRWVQQAWKRILTKPDESKTFTGFATSAEDDKVPILSKTDMDKNVLVGVCGAQGVGKTVFLAAVFHTMNGTVVEGLGRISSDRGEKGGARYFESIENTIRNIKENKAGPTQQSAVARLFAHKVDAHGAQSETGIILFDFAGGRFTDLANPNKAKQDADQQTREDIDLVAEYLERCDAFVLLIDSIQFSPTERSKANTNPFSDSVIHIIDHCELRHKPIALVFSKRDKNPDLTFGRILGFPRVKQFTERFTSNSTQSNKPFGIVDLVSAYEHDDLSARVLRHEDNMIWFEEPANVFTKVLQAAWPQATARLREMVHKEEEEKIKDEQDKERTEENRRRYLKLGIAATALIVVSFWIRHLWLQKHNQQADVAVVTEAAELLRVGKPERMESSHYDALQRLQASRGDAKVDASWSKLETAYLKSLQKMPASVYSGSEQSAATQNLVKLAGLLGSQGAEYLDLLRAHQQILAAAGNCKQPAVGERVALADSVPKSVKGHRDSAFIAALISEAAGLRAACANETVIAGTAQSTLMDRISFIRNRLAEEGNQVLDPRWKAALNRSYLKLLGASLTGLTARNSMVDLLGSSPVLKPLIETANNNFVQLVRYKFIMEAIRKLDGEHLEELRTHIAPFLGKFRHNDAGEISALADTLQTLFGVETKRPIDRQSLWLGLFEGADSEYLFVLSSDEWPSGYSPWKDELRARLKAANYSREETKRVIDDISQRSMYWREADGIASFAGDGHLGVVATRLFDEAVQRLGSGSMLNTRNSAGRIRQIAVLANAIHDGREKMFGVDSAMLRWQCYAAVQVAGRLESARSLARSQTPNPANWLQEFSETQLRSCGVGCAH